MVYTRSNDRNEEMRIILIEDDIEVSTSTQLLLELAGHIVTAYEDGSLILENVIDIPDIFIIDKLLPGVDGIDICRYLKSMPNTCNVPVIIISESPDAAKLAILACADGFLEKPFSHRQLLDIIASLASATI
jgi:CheY-like chemotaxis protein